MREIYVSVDVETDGPIPGVHSMISIGAVAITRDGHQIDTYYRNLLPLIGAKSHAKTMIEFWRRHPKAWEATQKNRQEADYVSREFYNWLTILEQQGKYKTVICAYPAGFDFSFLRHYVGRFANPEWQFSALDMKTLAMAILNGKYHETWKGSMPNHWFVENKFPHHALYDAENQAYTLAQMFKDLDKIHERRIHSTSA